MNKILHFVVIVAVLKKANSNQTRKQRTVGIVFRIFNAIFGGLFVLYCINFAYHLKPSLIVTFQELFWFQKVFIFILFFLYTSGYLFFNEKVFTEDEFEAKGIVFSLFTFFSFIVFTIAVDLILWQKIFTAFSYIGFVDKFDFSFWCQHGVILQLPVYLGVILYGIYIYGLHVNSQR